MICATLGTIIIQENISKHVKFEVQHIYFSHFIVRSSLFNVLTVVD
jgi:hypothetical protein